MATVGETSVLGTGGNTGPNTIVWFRFTAAASFTAQSMYMYAVTTGSVWDAGDRVVLGIYSGDATDPDALLGQTGEIVSTGSTGWISADLANTVEITDSVVYWLAFFSGDIIGWRGTNSGSRHGQETVAYSSTMPATYGGAIFGAWSNSIYASSEAVAAANLIDVELSNAGLHGVTVGDAGLHGATVSDSGLYGVTLSDSSRSS